MEYVNIALEQLNNFEFMEQIYILAGVAAFIGLLLPGGLLSRLITAIYSALLVVGVYFFINMQALEPAQAELAEAQEKVAPLEAKVKKLEQKVENLQAKANNTSTTN